MVIEIANVALQNLHKIIEKRDHFRYKQCKKAELLRNINLHIC